jgi:predicted MFS family arabinose efflux permease
VIKNSIWKNSQFVRFFTAFSVNNLGGWFDIFALQIIFVHEYHASSLLMAALILSYFIPGILFSSIAGVFADRHSKKKIMLVVSIFSAVLTMGLYFSQGPAIALLLMFVRAIVGNFDRPAQQAYVKKILPNNEQLLKASSYMSIVFSLCKVLGPMIGALLLLAVSARFCLLVNAASLVIAAFIIYSLPADQVKYSEIDLPQEKQVPWRQAMKEGARFVFQHNLLRNMILISLVWYICGMARLSQMAIFLKEVLPHNPDALGFVLGFDGLGAVLTGLWLSRKKSLDNPAIYFCIGFLLIAVGFLGITLYSASWPIVFLYSAALVLGLGSGINVVAYAFYLKRETPVEQMGRVTGISNTLQQFGQTIGTLACGLLAMWFGVRNVYFVLIALLFLLAVLSLTALKRTINVQNS